MKIRKDSPPRRQDAKFFNFRSLKLSKNCFGFRISDFGFTLIELLVALSLMVILSAVVVPSFFGNMRKAKDESAKRRGALLDVARTSYRAEVGDKVAQNDWTGKTDEQIYQLLLRSYLVAPPPYLGDGTASASSYYTPRGYRYSLGTNIATNTITYRIDGGVLTRIGP